MTMVTAYSVNLPPQRTNSKTTKLNIQQLPLFGKARNREGVASKIGLPRNELHGRNKILGRGGGKEDLKFKTTQPTHRGEGEREGRREGGDPNHRKVYQTQRGLAKLDCTIGEAKVVS